MRFAPFLLSACTLALVVVACADSDTTNSGNPIIDGGSSSGATKPKDSGGSETGPTCTKQTCETVDGACGDHDDGCGGKFNCGACLTDACAPASCEKLGKTCGTFDNQCGGTVNCGACTTACPKDAKEPNDKPESATDLGKASDYDNASVTVSGLQSSDGDEDWFKLAVTDGGFGGNPLISADVTDSTLEVAVFHVCNSKPDYSYCGGTGGTQEDTIGKGCFALASVKLNTDCKGIDESGTTYVRVRKRGDDGSCHAYNLTVKVE